MPGDERKISRLACLLLVTLRIAIGWHLLYEGWWKINSQSTAQPWSAEGYLKNATGPLRPHFRNMTGDPNDLRWVNYDQMAEKWDDWFLRFTSHFPGVNDKPENGVSVVDRLSMLIEGQKEFRVPLEELPEGVDLSKWKNAIRFDAPSKRLIVDGKQHLLPAERDAILALVPKIEQPTAQEAGQAAKIVRFRKAVEDLYKVQSRLSYKEQLAALLKGDPDRVGIIQKEKDGRVIEERMGKIDEYKSLLDRYEANYAKARTAFQWDHLQRQWGEIQQKRRELIGPVQALENELKIDAEKLLSAEQLAVGPVPERMTPMRSINLQTMWGLAVLGLLLIAGCFTRLAALGAAGLLTMFYLAAPPLPGWPSEQGAEHNLVINKVLIEALACLALVFLPTGRWFGVDALFAILFYRKPAR